MATTTVRLSEMEEQVLTALSEEYGGRSNVLREGLRLLDQQRRQREGLRAFLEEWETENGAIDPAGIERMQKKYFAD